MLPIKAYLPFHNNKWVLDLTWETMFSSWLLTFFDTVPPSTSLNKITYLTHVLHEHWFTFPLNIFFLCCLMFLCSDQPWPWFGCTVLVSKFKYIHWIMVALSINLQASKKVNQNRDRNSKGQLPLTQEHWLQVNT